MNKPESEAATEGAKTVAFSEGLGGMTFPEKYRWADAPHPYGSTIGDRCGIFRVPPQAGNGRWLKVIAVDGAETGWEHVSVSVAENPSKCPSWPEMCAVKKLFWHGEACVVQYHPRSEDYVNIHPGVLHLWRSTNAEFPTPPTECV